MSLPSSLLAFATFKTLQKSYSHYHQTSQGGQTGTSSSSFFNRVFFSSLADPFTDVENVFVQSLAVAVGTGPLAFGFVGVIPAIEKFLTPDEAGIPSQNNTASPSSPVSQINSNVTNNTNDPISSESPISFSLLQLIIWSSALAFFGVFFGVLLRRPIIVKEKLRFPSGSATATMIAVLHQNEISQIHNDSSQSQSHNYSPISTNDEENDPNDDNDAEIFDDDNNTDSNGQIMRPTDTIQLEHLSQQTYSENIRILLISFTVSASYSLFSYFFPILRNIPIFGNKLAKDYLWTFQPSPAYFGQGIIMGLPTVSAMLFGAILGWAILGPMAQHLSWATGPVDDWKTGAQGWILWVSLAIMVADTVVSFITITSVSLYKMNLINRNSGSGSNNIYPRENKLKIKNILLFLRRFFKGKSSIEFVGPHQSDGYGTSYSPLETSDLGNDEANREGIFQRPYQNEVTADVEEEKEEEEEPDAFPKHLISTKFAIIGLILSCIYCIIALKLTFLLPTRSKISEIYSASKSNTISLLEKSSTTTIKQASSAFHFDMPVFPIVAAVFLALLLAILGVRALGETDLNPVSGIGKISQLIFAILVPPKSHPAAVLINLVAGGVTEAGAQQAGDLMQDLKTGHLVGASPRAQFIAQLIGSLWSVLLSAAVYRLYDKVYTIPGSVFRVPTAVVWIDCARLVTGKGLPPHVWGFAWVLGLLFALLAMIKVLAPTLTSIGSKTLSAEHENNNNSNYDDASEQTYTETNIESLPSNSRLRPLHGDEETSINFQNNESTLKTTTNTPNTTGDISVQIPLPKTPSQIPGFPNPTTLLSVSNSIPDTVSSDATETNNNKGNTALDNGKYLTPSANNITHNNNHSHDVDVPKTFGSDDEEDDMNKNVNFTDDGGNPVPNSNNSFEQLNQLPVTPPNTNPSSSFSTSSNHRATFVGTNNNNNNNVSASNAINIQPHPPISTSFSIPIPTWIKIAWQPINKILHYTINILGQIVYHIAKHSRYIPSGVAVGIGIYNTPSFTLARFLGGAFAAYWMRRYHSHAHKSSLSSSSHSNNSTGPELKIVVLSSGLVLGEGVFSIISLIMTSLGVPHF